MVESDLNQRPPRHFIMSLLYILILVGLGFVIVGPAIGLFASLPFYPGSWEALQKNLMDNQLYQPDMKIPLYFMQAFATLVGLVLTPMMILKRYQTSVGVFFRNDKVEWLPVLITSFVVVIFMALNSVVVEWNANFDFPDFANGFEQWARSREDAAAEATEFLTTFSSSFELMAAIVVIAILPAVGEEIVFRGLIQNELYRGTRNIHVSIWISAILFSAIHMQFFGFVPRLLLGALFGYLYFWSGSLFLAILAHFVNNGVSVIALYLYQKGSFSIDPEAPEAAPAHLVMISLVLTAGLLYYFYKYFEHRKRPIPEL